MEYSIKAKFIIISNSYNIKTGNLCILKGLLGSEYEIMKEQDEKINRNSISTLLLKRNKHGKIIKHIKTGCKIKILGKINIVKNRHQHIQIEEVSIDESQ
ncbi:MAG: hypothetical protein VX737_05850 [Pseudomonadota bacterium]|nr:hypothetical protein [Pseudomonadota bacterium]